MCHPKNTVFSRIENLITEKYHDTKKLTVSQKISLTWSVSLHVIKMSQNSPLILNLFSNAMVSWNENEETVLKLNQEKYNNKTKMKSGENQLQDIFHPGLFKNEGTSTLRTSLKKNILEKDAAYIFVGKTFKIRNGSLSRSQMF